MKDIKEQLIRLGSEKPELQDHLRPIIAEVDKTSFVVLDTKYAQASLRELEMAALVLMVNICVNHTMGKLQQAGNYTHVSVEAVDGLGIELRVDLDQLSAEAYGSGWFRVEVRANERAMYIGSRKIATIRKEDSIAKAGKYLGKVLTSKLLHL